MPQIAELAASLPTVPAIEVPPLPEGAPALAAMANAAAAIEMAASMAASGTLEAMLAAEVPPLSMEGVLALEAMAQVGGGMGIDMMAPSASAELSLAAGSLNVAAPALSELGAALGAALGPAMAPAGGLPAPLAISAAIEAALGIDMAAPGAAAALEAALSAAIEASAALSAAGGLALSAEATMNLALAARALNAAVALGLDPSDPPALAASLEAAVEAGLEVPPLSMSAEEMGEVSAGLGDLAMLNQAAGGAELSMAAPAIEAAAGAMTANMEAAVAATAGMAAELSAAGGAGAELAAALAAAAEAPMPSAPALAAAGLEGLPAMGDLPLALAMAQSFEAATGTPMIPEAGCPNIFCVGG